MKHLLETFGIADKVIMDLRYIPLNEIGALMELATAVVYPYRSSTQSGSLQVAYTFGKPVIATAVGGLPEVVEDGKSGFLVQPHSITDLAEKISSVMNDPSLAAEMGRYARHLSVTRFNWDSIALQMLGQYKDMRS
jgi:glycosyltransferase involved in cell wall biosynthesis